MGCVATAIFVNTMTPAVAMRVDAIVNFKIIITYFKRLEIIFFKCTLKSAFSVTEIHLLLFNKCLYILVQGQRLICLIGKSEMFSRK